MVFKVFDKTSATNANKFLFAHTVTEINFNSDSEEDLQNVKNIKYIHPLKQQFVF